MKKIIYSMLCLLMAFSSQAQYRQLVTSPPLNGGNGNGGVSFNIATSRTVIIDTIYVSVYGSAAQNVDVWYNPTAINNAAPVINAANGWVLLGTASMTPTGTSSLGVTPTPIPLPALNLVMLPGDEAGFYVGGYGIIAYSTWSAANQSIFTDGTLTINTGPGAGYGGPLSPTIATRQFNGIISYRLVSGAADDAAVQSIDQPINFCGGTQNVMATIANFGNNIINSVNVNWSVDGVLQTPVAYTQPIDTFGGAGNATASVALGTYSFVSGINYNVEVWTSSPNGQPDSNTSNDSIAKAVQSSLSGNFTIGNNKDFPDILSATTALENYGICGNVNFTIDAGTYVGNHTLTNVPGASSGLYSIQFASASGLVDVVVTNGTSGTVFDINGTNAVTFSGMHFVKSNSPSAVEFALNFAKSSFNNVIGCIIEAPTTLTTSSNRCLGIQDNSNFNTISGCEIIGGYYGAYILGTAAVKLANNTLSFCNIHDQYFYGIFSSYNTAPVFDNNTIVDVKGTVSSYGAYLNVNDNFIVSNNKFLGTIGAYGIYCFNFSGDINLPNSIYNNELSYSTSNVSPRGIYLSSSSSATDSTDYLDVFNNSINLTHLVSNANINGALYIASSTTIEQINGLNIANNIFTITPGLGITPMTNYSGIFINSPLALANAVLDFNNYYITGSTNAVYTSYNTTYHDLNAWQLFSGQDQNSYAVNPIFALPSLAIPNTAALNNTGTPISYITTDITGAARSSTPDIGAYEFISKTNDIGVTADVTNTKNGCIVVPMAVVSARITSFGSNFQTGFNISYQINSDPIVTEVVNDTVFSGLALVYNFATPANFANPLTDTLRIWTSLINDEDINNDSTTTYYNNYIPGFTGIPYNQGFESGLFDVYTCIDNGINANASISTGAGTFAPIYGNNSLLFTSNATTGTFSTSIVPDPFSQNFDFQSAATINCNTAGQSTLALEFDMDQHFYSLAQYCILRVSVDGTPVIPEGYNTPNLSLSGTLFNNQIKHIKYRLTPYLTGGNQEILFQAITRWPANYVAAGGNYIGIDSLQLLADNAVYIDSVTEAMADCSTTAKSISALVSSAPPITSVSLHYDIVGAGTYVSTPMVLNSSTNLWDATIPPAARRGISSSYYVVATNSMGGLDTSEVNTYVDGYLNANIGPDTSIVAGTTLVIRNRAVSGSGVKLSEFDLGATDSFELMNAGNAPINVNGWTVAVSNSYTVFGSVNANTKTLTGILNPGDIITYSDGASASNYWGSNLFWNPGNGIGGSFTGWAIILDQNNDIVDFVAWDWAAADIAAGTLTINGATVTIGSEWSGDGILSTPASAGNSLNRQGNSDNNTDADWTTLTTSIGTRNSGLGTIGGGGYFIWSDGTTVLGTADTLAVSPLVNSTYYLTLTDSICTVYDTINVTVTAALPDAGVSAIVTPSAGSLVSQATVVTVTIKNYSPIPVSGFDVAYSGNGGTSVTETYVGTIAPGATANYTFNQQWTPAGGNWQLCAYTVGIPNDPNRNNDTTCVTLRSNVSVEEIAIDNAIVNVYPVPANDVLYMALGAAKANAEVKVFDAQGKLMLSQGIQGTDSQTLKLDISKLSSGVYTWKYISNKEVQNGNFVITR